MPFVSRLLLLVALTGVTAEIAAAGPNEKMCAGLIDDRSAALTVDDWTALRNLSVNFLRDCKSVVSRDTLSLARADIAIAYSEQGQFREALKSADECVKQHYSHPSCHYARGQALAGLKQNADAKQAFRRAEQLATQQIDAAQGVLTQPHLAWEVQRQREAEVSMLTSLREAARNQQAAL